MIGSSQDDSVIALLLVGIRKVSSFLVVEKSAWWSMYYRWFLFANITMHVFIGRWMYSSSSIIQQSKSRHDIQ